MKTQTLLVALLVAGAAAGAQTVEVTDAWVRTSVQGQRATGAFMTITARETMKLVAVSTPVAAIAEVHEMKMEGDVMKMRPVAGGIDLPAGKSINFTPGGYHMMLMDLKATLPRDSTVPLTLVFRDAKGTESRLELKLPVATVAPFGSATGAPAHKH